jgi:transcriptional regulator with XRE-family HTH domain
VSERRRKPKSATWEDRLSAQVGLNIAVARAEAGLTAQELSDALTQGGVPLGRPAISQIETGQRAVSLAEALAIAAVLGVAPAELVYAPSPDPVEALPGEASMTGAEAADWLRGYLPRPAPHESRSEWLGRAAEEQAAQLTVNPWTLLSRLERQLHFHHRNVEQAEVKLAAAADAIDRLNAQHERDSAVASAIASARQLETILGASPDADGFEPHPETAALLGLYKDRDLPALGIPPNHLARAWANQDPG